MRDRGIIGDERGVAMAEFALIVPVLMLVVAGMLEFGRAINYWIDANHLANEGARWAAVDRTPSGPNLQQYLYDQAVTQELQSGLQVCADYPGTSHATANIGDPLRVRVKKDFSFIPFLDQPAVTLVGTSTMRIERIVGNDPTTDPLDNLGACT